MLTVDFLMQMKRICNGLEKEKFIGLTSEGKYQYCELTGFINKALDNRFKYIYEYTDDSDGESFTTKFIMVPQKCTWSFEIEEFISTEECVMVPKKYYEFIYFLGIHFLFSFCIEKDGGKWL